MPDDWIKVRGPTPTEMKTFEEEAQTKRIIPLLLVLLLVAIVLLTWVLPSFNRSGQEGALCKTSADCGQGFCCGGYISQTGPNAGYATCRAIGKSTCFP